MKEHERKSGLAFYIILTLVIFIIDILTPRGIGISFLYIFPILTIAEGGNKNKIIIVTFISTSLLIIGYFLSPAGYNPEYFILINRILGLSAIWVFTLLLLRHNESEKKSKRNEQILNLILDNINQGIIVSDAPDGKATAISKWGINHTLGKSKDAIIDLPLERYLEQWDVRDLTTGEKIKPENSPIAKALKGNVIKNEEWLMVRPDGTSFITSVNAVPIFNPVNSKVTNVVASWEDITERKKAEEEFMHEKNYADELADLNMEILETSPYGIATYEADGNCTYANEALCKIIGATRSQALGQNFHQIKAWKESGMYELAIEALHTGLLQSKEVHHITSFGKEIQIEAKFIPFKAFDKTNLLFMINDITHLKKIERNLEENQKQLSSIIYSAMDGIMVIDENLKIVIYNEACEKMFSVPSAEAIGESIERFIPISFHEKHRENVDLFSKSSHTNKMMGNLGYVKAIKPTGEEFPIEASLSQYEINGKKYYTVIHRDISERINAEKALQQSEEKFSIAFRANPNALVLSRLDNGRIEEVNETFLKLFGYEASEVIGKTSFELNMYVNPEDRDRAVYLLRRDGRISEFEVRIRTKTEERIALLSSELIQTKGGQSFLTIIQDITEKISAEKTLRESEAKLLDAQKLAHVGSFAFDIQTKKIEWTPETYNIYELDPQNEPPPIEIIHTYFHPEDREQVLQTINNGMKNNTIINLECRLLLHNGKTKYVSYVGKPVYDSTGKPIKRIGAISDITDRKLAQLKMEETLKKHQESESRLLDAQKLALMGNYSLDVRTGNIEWSDQMYDIWEVDRNKPVPKFDELWNKIYPDDRENVKEVLSQEINENEKVETEFRILFNDNRIKYIHVITSGYFDESGNLVKRQGVEIDITERKIQQQKLEKLLGELKESEAKLLEAQHLAHIGSFETDIETQKVKWSEEVFNIYEMDISKGEPSYKEAMSFNHPDDCEYIREEIEKGTNSNQLFEFDYRIIVNEKVKYLHYMGKPILDNSGKVIKRSGTIMDITDRKHTQIAMEELLYDLQRSNKDLEQFAYIASHDLQEPIRMIRSYTELLNRKYKTELDENALEYLGFITESSVRMQQLVTDLLKYSRISTQAKSFEKVDCNEILTEVIGDLRFVIQETNAGIEFGQLPVVKADRTQIRQVFQNLIQNAIKFTKDRNPVIVIRSENRKNVWLFSVMDNGIGIDQQYLERIFVIFQRLHTKEEYPGTGIGLSLVKKIVESHGGQVCAESILGKGSIFYFTLPVS